MRANIIRTDDPETLMKLSLGTSRDPASQNYFKEQYNNFTNRVSEYSGSFFNTVKTIYNYVTDSNVINRAKRLLTSVNNSGIEDTLITYVNSTTIHNPGLTMRRYLMAKPDIYDKYSKNLCSGYNDEWVNEEVGMKPTLRDDYLNVIDGEVTDTHTTFYNDENPLNTRDRFIIKNAWDTMDELIATGIDPTNFEEDGEI